MMVCSVEVGNGVAQAAVAFVFPVWIPRVFLGMVPGWSTYIDSLHSRTQSDLSGGLASTHPESLVPKKKPGILDLPGRDDPPVGQWAWCRGVLSSLVNCEVSKVILFSVLPQRSAKPNPTQTPKDIFFLHPPN